MRGAIFPRSHLQGRDEETGDIRNGDENYQCVSDWSKTPPPPIQFILYLIGSLYIDTNIYLHWSHQRHFMVFRLFLLVCLNPKSCAFLHHPNFPRTGSGDHISYSSRWNKRIISCFGNFSCNKTVFNAGKHQLGPVSRLMYYCRPGDTINHAI